MTREPNVFGDRRQEGRAATDDDRIAEHAQLAELDTGLSFLSAGRSATANDRS